MRQALEIDEPLPAQPDTDTFIRVEMLAVADAIIDNTTTAPPEDQLVRAVIETRTIASQYRRLELQLPKGLAWRAAQAGARLDAVVDDLFTPTTEEIPE